MTKGQRAAQIWPVLSLAATQRQTLSYDLLSKLIGVPRPAVGGFLEPIQSYCILKSRPPLTVLVVSAKSGLPGEGFIAASDVPRAQAEVYEHDWLQESVPSDTELEAAVATLPSNGKSLEDLLRQRGAGEQ